MESYSQFAEVYDRLMNDANYKGRTDYLLKLFKKHGKIPTLLLDLACGTGGFSNQMALKGIEVIGVDMSEEMLWKARENSAELETDVLFLCQKAEKSRFVFTNSLPFRHLFLFVHEDHRGNRISFPLSDR